MINAQGNKKTRAELNKYIAKSAAEIAVYAATKEFETKIKIKWPHQPTRPFLCFCRMPVTVGAVTSVGPKIEHFAYPYISCHYKNQTYANNRPRTCVFYINLSEF